MNKLNTQKFNTIMTTKTMKHASVNIKERYNKMHWERKTWKLLRSKMTEATAF